MLAFTPRRNWKPSNGAYYSVRSTVQRFREAAFLAALFLVVLFLAEVFFAALRFVAVFLAGALFVAVFLVALADLLLPLLLRPGAGGMFAPERRASLKPMAIACFGFLTFRPLRPDSSS